MEEIAMDEQRRLLIQERARQLDEAYAETKRSELESTQKIVESRAMPNIKQIANQMKQSEQVDKPKPDKAEVVNDPWEKHQLPPAAATPSAHPSGSFETYRPGTWQPKSAKRVS